MTPSTAEVPRDPVTPSNAEVPRVAAIDRFRGIAILLVVLYHINGLLVFPNGWGITRDAGGASHILAGPNLLRFLLLPVHFGRIGVNLFFVISGLCIHLRMAVALHRDRAAPFSPRVYFLRRFYRIYPVYWIALFVGISLSPWLYGVEFPTPGSIATHLVMVHSFFKPYILDILPPLWSIATEEQFYLLYPLVFVWLGRRMSTPRIILLLLFLSLAWRLLFVFSNPAPLVFSDGPFLVWLHGFSIARYYEWGLGALLAWAIADGRGLRALAGWPFAWLSARPHALQALGLLFIVTGAASLIHVRLKWIIEEPCYSTGWFLIMASVLLPAAPRPAHPLSPGFAWMIPARPRSPFALRWFDARLRGLGRRSFSVYLLHELVQLQVVWLVKRYDLPRLLVGAPLAYALTIILCYAFYRVVEAPFEIRSKAVR